MEREFFDLFEKHRDILRLEVGYLRNSDWTIGVYDHRMTHETISLHQGPDRALVFAKAYADLAEWYSAVFGGY
jgi:hypothetical protein